jgi:outer membrane protein TolC
MTPGNTSLRPLFPAFAGVIVIFLFPLWAQEVPPASAKMGPQPQTTPILAPEAIGSEQTKIRTLRLDECVRLALAQNLEIAIQRLEPQISATDETVASGVFDPRLRLSGDYSENSTPRLAEQIAADGRASVNSRSQNGQASLLQTLSPGTELSFNVSTRNSQSTFNQFSDEFGSNTGVSLRQPLLRNFGSDVNLSPLRIARRGIAAADAAFQFRVELVVSDVASAYYELVYARRDLESRRQSLALAQQLLDDNRTRAELGAMSRLDVSQANGEVASRQETVLLAEAALRERENALKRLITTDLSSLLSESIEPADPPFSVTPALAPGEAIRTGLLSRPDLKEARERAEAQRLRVSYQKNQFLPLLDLRASAGLSGLSGDFGTSYDNIRKANDPQWLVGLTMEIPLGNDDAMGRLKSAELRQEQTLLQLKSLEQDIVQQIDNAAMQARINQQRIETTRTARTLSEETLAAEQDKLKAGSSTSFVVLRLQRDLDDARTRELRAQADAQKSLIELQRVQGKLLEAYRIELR